MLHQSFLPSRQESAATSKAADDPIHLVTVESLDDTIVVAAPQRPSATMDSTTTFALAGGRPNRSNLLFMMVGNHSPSETGRQMREFMKSFWPLFVITAFASAMPSGYLLFDMSPPPAMIDLWCTVFGIWVLIGIQNDARLRKKSPAMILAFCSGSRQSSPSLGTSAAAAASSRACFCCCCY